MRRADGAPQRVDHDQQFHQIVVGGKAGGLDDEHVLAADIFLDLDKNFHVGEAAHLRLDRRQLEILADGLGQGRLELPVIRRMPREPFRSVIAATPPMKI